MAISRTALRAASAVLPERAQEFFLARLSNDLKRELTGKLTDAFLDALLKSMEIAFALSSGYRKNIEGFEAVFVFRTRTGGVGASAVFHRGAMRMDREPRPAWDTRLTFKDAEGLARALLAGDAGLDTMLSNPVDVDGNLSCLYRFGFLAKELTLKLGVG